MIRLVIEDDGREICIEYKTMEIAEMAKKFYEEERGIPVRIIGNNK